MTGSTNRLFLLVLIGLGVRLYIARDHFLHEWDERFHALVAKNLIDDPLKPVLYKNPVEPYDYKDWTRNHIWLSKPPVPLWLMAASINTFGIHEYSVRVPGVLAAVLTTLLTYLIALRFLNKDGALMAAALHAIHPVISDLAGGRVSSDGVESVFLFFVTLGCYFAIRDQKGRPKAISYLLTGMASGLAIMSKWQPGILPVLIMFIYHFSWKTLWRHVGLTSLSVFMCCLILGPWLVYIWLQYNEETRWMLRALFTPFVDETINPDGTWYSYLTDFGNFFGYTTYLLLGVWCYAAWHKMDKDKLALLVWAVLPLLIFSFAEVKRGTYLMISAPAIFIIISSFASNRIIAPSLNKYLRFAACISVLSILISCVEKLHLFNPKDSSPQWSIELKQRQYLNDTVIYNEPHYVEAMFYHNIVAYDFDEPENSPTPKP